MLHEILWTNSKLPILNSNLIEHFNKQITCFTPELFLAADAVLKQGKVVKMFFSHEIGYLYLKMLLKKLSNFK